MKEKKVSVRFSTKGKSKNLYCRVIYDKSSTNFVISEPRGKFNPNAEKKKIEDLVRKESELFGDRHQIKGFGIRYDLYDDPILNIFSKVVERDLFKELEFILTYRNYIDLESFTLPILSPPYPESHSGFFKLIFKVWYSIFEMEVNHKSNLSKDLKETIASFIHFVRFQFYKANRSKTRESENRMSNNLLQISDYLFNQKEIEREFRQFLLNTSLPIISDYPNLKKSFFEDVFQVFPCKNLPIESVISGFKESIQRSESIVKIKWSMQG